jgi:hypothetical protein
MVHLEATRKSSLLIPIIKKDAHVCCREATEEIMSVHFYYNLEDNLLCAALDTRRTARGPFFYYDPADGVWTSPLLLSLTAHSNAKSFWQQREQRAAVRQAKEAADKDALRKWQRKQT